jgi:hypothetical protein
MPFGVAMLFLWLFMVLTFGGLSRAPHWRDRPEQPLEQKCTMKGGSEHGLHCTGRRPGP